MEFCSYSRSLMLTYAFLEAERLCFEISTLNSRLSDYSLSYWTLNVNANKSQDLYRRRGRLETWNLES